jgi:GNAT superfamily N-acetyltransferase
MVALLRELFWPAVAGNVVWALFTVAIKEDWYSECILVKITALLSLAIYLAVDWLWTTKENIITPPKTYFWLAECPFLIAVVTFAISTQDKKIPEDILWSEISLAMAFVFAIIGHCFGLWESTRSLSPPRQHIKIFKLSMPLWHFSQQAWTRLILVSINFLGVVIVTERWWLFESSKCWHLPLAVIIPFLLWIFLYYKVDVPNNGGLTVDFKCRKAEPKDTDEIATLALQLIRETEGHNLDRATVEQGISELIIRTEKSEATLTSIYAAELISPNQTGPTIIGYLTVCGAEWSEWDNGIFLWLGSSYVLPQFRGNHVAKTLYEEAIKYARSIGALGLKAYVYDTNKDAKRAHEKVGQKLTKFIITENRF